MNVDEALRQFQNPDFPREAAQWSLDHWEEASPRLISKLRNCAGRGSDAETDLYALEYIVHLCAEKRDARAFTPLCDLIANDENVGAWLPPSEELSGLLINLCDGDVDPLKRAIESPEGDAFMRGAVLTALAYLARERAVLGDDEMRGYLLHLRDTMQPRGESYMWAAWASAVGRLGYEPMRAEVGRLFTEGWIAREDLELGDFYSQLQLSRRDVDGLAAFHEEGIRPFESTIEKYEALSTNMSLDGVRDRDEHDLDSEYDDLPTPYINPHRDVGRNDPCICGSGKKYKKCCLRAGASAAPENHDEPSAR